MKLNFREAYRAQYQQIAPDARLLAVTEELLCERLYAPKKRLPVGWRAAALAGLCLMLAVSPGLLGLWDDVSEDMLESAISESLAHGGASVDHDVMHEDQGIAAALREDGPKNSAAVLANDKDDQDNKDDIDNKDKEIYDEVDGSEYLGVQEFDGELMVGGVCGLPKMSDTRRLTADELYGMAEYAALLPVAVPRGYVLESAGLSEDENGSLLHITWTRGYDYIRMQVRPSAEVAVDEIEARTVDINRPEMWDPEYYIGLLADGQPRHELWQMVPDELYTAMNDPIFAVGDISGEVLGKRCGPSDDEGHYYGVFSVLCDDMLVEYAVRSDDLAAVWAAISSAEGFAE